LFPVTDCTDSGSHENNGGGILRLRVVSLEPLSDPFLQTLIGVLANRHGVSVPFGFDQARPFLLWPASTVFIAITVLCLLIRHSLFRLCNQYSLSTALRHPPVGSTLSRKGRQVSNPSPSPRQTSVLALPRIFSPRAPGLHRLAGRVLFPNFLFYPAPHHHRRLVPMTGGPLLEVLPSFSTPTLPPNNENRCNLRWSTNFSPYGSLGTPNPNSPL